MADVINLRLARKSRARAVKAAAADANRAVHGRTKAEREQTAAITALRERRLDAAKREE